MEKGLGALFKEREVLSTCWSCSFQGVFSLSIISSKEISSLNRQMHLLQLGLEIGDTKGLDRKERTSKVSNQMAQLKSQ